MVVENRLNNKPTITQKIVDHKMEILHYEEASYAPGCYRVEVVKFLEPGDNSVVKDESYYDYKKKKLVLRFLFHEDWCSAEDWDAYYYSAVE